MKIIAKKKLLSISNKMNTKNIENNNDNDNGIINPIELNIFCIHFGFCFVRKKKNVQNILLNESMKLITEKLDILNIFRIMYLNENIQSRYEFKKDFIQMSNKCKHSLKNINIS